MRLALVWIDLPFFGMSAALAGQAVLLNAERSEGGVRHDADHLHLPAAERAGVDGAALGARLQRGDPLFQLIEPRRRLCHALPQRPLLKRTENCVYG